MITLKIAVFSIDEMKNMLADWYVEFLANDRAHAESLFLGGIGKAIPDLTTIRPDKLVELCRDFNIASSYLDDHDTVYLDAGDDTLIKLYPGDVEACEQAKQEGPAVPYEEVRQELGL